MNRRQLNASKVVPSLCQVGDVIESVRVVEGGENLQVA